MRSAKLLPQPNEKRLGVTNAEQSCEGVRKW